ncbi:MAG TPA: glycoside hydrolase family 38 C-terminal domain-containing protein [Ktedonobacterales bacterium]
MAESTQLLVVPHTHWDREWYATFQQFRVRLVKAVDKVLDVLEADPAFTDFMLDGQTVVLEDYLEVRPENVERLRKLANAHRIVVGPWYLQPDEFLVSGESLIRNLQLGMRIAAGFGGPMMVGYVPDVFGHIAQLPQLLRGFGIDNAVYWRGVGPDVDRSEFRWAAPDGTTVLVVWLCDALGYSNARTLPLQTDALLARLDHITPPLAHRATTATLLLMNGSDHLEPQAGLPAALAEANHRLKARHEAATIGTLRQYVDTVLRADPPLATYTGEMRSSRYAHLLPGVLSTRMWIKQRNATCEALLSRWAEPASSWAWLLGEPYPQGLLRVAWRQLLWNHPHDSICGTGIDQVHDEMRSRFDQSEQVAEALTVEALGNIAANADTRLPAGAAEALPLVVFNAGPTPRSDIVVAKDIGLISEDIRVLDSAGHAVPHELRAFHRLELLAQDVAKGLVTSMINMVQGGRVEGYAIVAVQFSDGQDTSVEQVTVTVSEHGEPNLPAVEAARARILQAARRDALSTFHLVAQELRADVAFLSEDVPAFGARTFFLEPQRQAPSGPDSAPATTLVAEPAAIENEHFRVEADAATGTLTVTDKATGARYPGLNLFQDGGDVGDLYNYSPPRDDFLVANPRYRPRIELVNAGPVAATLRVTVRYELPQRCSENRRSRHFEVVECPIVSEVTLVPGARRVEIRTEVENLARDHRLRVLFPAPLMAGVSEAEGTFEVTRRPIRQPRPGPDESPWSEWVETPVDTHPQRRFVDVSDGRVGLAVLNRGLPEYEVLPWPVNKGVAVALTLLRCVEWLSRGDLDTRHGHAGPMEYTPEAQCLGQHVFEYAIVPHPGTWREEDALPLREAQAFEAPLRARLTSAHQGKLPGAWSFATVEPGAVVLSAVKRAEDEDALVVRLYNPTERALETTLRMLFPFREARLATLNEALVADGAAHPLTRDGDQGVRLALRGGEIATLLLRF